MTYLMVAGGLVLLLLGGDVLVRGAVALAQRFDVPPLVIGLTVVAFGTSAPELVVSLGAALKGLPEIAIGNVVGSNIANVLLVLGLPAMISPIACNIPGIGREAAIMAAGSVLFMAMCYNGSLGPVEGGVLALGLVAYLGWSYHQARKDNGAIAEALVDELEGIAARPHSLWLVLLFILGGLCGLVLGSNLLVDGAVGVARSAGVPESVIGLTLVALGTSMPELATSMVAAIRRHGDVALGNVIGSNLFNLLGIMGTTALVIRVPVPKDFLDFDLWVLLATALLTMPFVVGMNAIGRRAGGLLTLAYIAYVYTLFHGASALSGSTGHIAF
ncbi:MAG TPA: calcium/sodium antiporter [Alphaproteobacteria bacterium]|nr:calcium/sodium antiporter [Alphaproteobacteria bacterium]